jgi:hypothetical protein
LRTEPPSAGNARQNEIDPPSLPAGKRASCALRDSLSSPKRCSGMIAWHAIAQRARHFVGGYGLPLQRVVARETADSESAKLRQSTSRCTHRATGVRVRGARVAVGAADDHAYDRPRRPRSLPEGEAPSIISVEPVRSVGFGPIRHHQDDNL